MNSCVQKRKLLPLYSRSKQIPAQNHWRQAKERVTDMCCVEKDAARFQKLPVSIHQIKWLLQILKKITANEFMYSKNSQVTIRLFERFIIGLC